MPAHIGHSFVDNYVDDTDSLTVSSLDDPCDLALEVNHVHIFEKLWIHSRGSVGTYCRSRSRGLDAWDHIA